MANVSPEEGTRFLDPNDAQSQIREFIKAKSTVDFLEERMKTLRSKIFEYVEEHGEEESNGSFRLSLDSSVDGVLAIQKNRRASRKLDELKADEIIASAGLEDELYEMKRVVNEEALMAAYYEGKITEEQLDEMFPTTVVWALRTLKK
jgi:hypothetical protein